MIGTGATIGENGGWKARLRVLVVLLCLVSVGMPAPARSTSGGTWSQRGTALAGGVEHVELVRPGPAAAVVNVARVAAGADVELRAVVAHDRVGHASDAATETTSGMCARVNGTVCINGDFAMCFTCGQPFGGVVRDGEVLRSFRGGHDQLSVVDGTPTTDVQRWTGRLVATYGWPAGAGRGEERDEVPLDGLNVDPIADGTVLYTPSWGSTTPVVGGGHLRITMAGPLTPGVVQATPVVRHGEGAVDIGTDVLASADGADAEALSRFWERWRTTDAGTKRLTVETQLIVPASLSVGGHPRLLESGRRLALNGADPKVRDRHPRTLVGWSGTGQMWLVTVDGRQPGRSNGMTLHEATDLLVELGATDGLNLDGGGSTTFVGRCPSGLCVANRPSGGGERRVPVALALIGRTPPPAPVVEPAPPERPAAAAPPPEPEPAPVPEAEPPVVEPAAEPEPLPPIDVPSPAEEPPAEVAPEPPATTVPAPVAPPLDRGLAMALAASRPRPVAPPGAPELPQVHVVLAAALVVATATVTIVRIRPRRRSPSPR